MSDRDALIAEHMAEALYLARQEAIRLLADDRDALIAALSPDTVIAPEHMAEALYLARQEAIRLTGDRDRLASLLEKLRPYLPHARHNIGCPARRRDDCTCGLADLLAEMENR